MKWVPRSLSMQWSFQDFQETHMYIKTKDVHNCSSTDLSSSLQNALETKKRLPCIYQKWRCNSFKQYEHWHFCIEHFLKRVFRKSLNKFATLDPPAKTGERSGFINNWEAVRTMKYCTKINIRCNKIKWCCHVSSYSAPALAHQSCRQTMELPSWLSRELGFHRIRQMHPLEGKLPNR